ncbi:MAG TPA: hypothetical protein VH575_31250 [Gemmataceae bacterium]|jgi:hypothetical protein
MLLRLFRCLVAVLLVLSLSLPFAAGQSDLPTVERGVSGDSPFPSETSGSSSPSVLPYFVLAIYTMLVLTIVCVPSRKA